MENNKEQMIPAKDKAKELINHFLNASFNCKNCDMPFCDVPCTMLNLTEAKECSIITVDKILIAIQDLPIDEFYWDYYQQVKQQIETYEGDNQ
jgi:hypothetical protein